jgi:hypothetical protein
MQCPGGACVNLNNDNANCGSCGNICSAGSVCVNTVCTSSPGTGGAGNTVGTGGAGGRGGSGGGGGTSGTSCGSAFAVAANGYVTTPALARCWSGYAYAGGDAGSLIMPANFSACGTPCTLRMMGTVGPAVMANNYAGVAHLGFNLSQESTGTTAAQVAPAGSGLTVTFSASTGGLPLRAQLGTSSGTFWCYTITGASPVNIPYSMFNTACWDNSGAAYAKQPVQHFQLVVPGGAAATSMSVTLTSVREY